MQALLDNDVLSKLAKYNLLNSLDSGLEALGMMRPYRVLPSAKYALHASKPNRKYWPNEDARARLVDFIAAKCEPISEIDYSELEALNAPGLDSGEMILVAAAIADPEAFLITSDKTALRALGGNPLLAEHALVLRQRVIPFETVIDYLNRHMGWDAVAAAVRSDDSADTNLRFIYREPTPERCTEVLRGSIRALTTECGAILVDTPIDVTLGRRRRVP